MIPPTQSKKVGKRRLLALTLLAWCTLAQPLDLDRRIDQFHHKGWTAEDGAPTQISSIAQTVDGQLWLGSTQGLHRFDGFEFQRFEPSNGTPLPSFNVYAIEPDATGGLWVSFRPSGLGYIEGGRLTVFTQPGELPPSQAYVLRLVDGELLAGTHKGLFGRRDTAWVPLHEEHGLPALRVHAIVASPQGVLVMIDNTVYLRARGQQRFEQVFRSPHLAVDLRLAPDGDLWLNHSRGLTRIQDWETGLARSSTWPTQWKLPTLTFLVDRDGALWMSSIGDLYRIRDLRELASINEPLWQDHMAAQAGLAAGNIDRIFEDRDGNIWIVGVRGLDRFRSNAIVPLQLAPLVEQPAVTLTLGRDGDLWFATATLEEQLYRVDRVAREGRSPRVGTGSGPVFARSVHHDRDGNTWWAGQGAVYQQRGTTVKKIAGPPSLRGREFWEVTPAATQPGLWVSIDEDGLWQLHEGTWQRATLPAGMLERGPSATLAEGEESWFGYTGNRVRVIAGGTVRAYGEGDGLDIGRIKVIRGQRRHKWLGGELGLALFDRGRFHRVRIEGGEPLGAVGGIIESRSGDVWLAEMRSIVRIAASEVEGLLRDPSQAIRAKRYTSGDGLRGAPQMNTTGSTAVETADGVLWFATDAGLAWIDPAKLGAPRKSPDAHPIAVLADGRTYAPNEALRLPLGVRQFDVVYRAVEITMPERVRFRFRLEGYDADWRDAADQRKASYAKVPPGRYLFQVQTALDGGAWSTGGAALPIVIEPRYWETVWFAVLCTITAAGLLALAYMRRVSGVRREMLKALQHRHDERERIARDLHDTLLQGFQGLVLRFHTLMLQMPTGSTTREAMERALQRADQALIEARDSVTRLRRGSTGRRPLGEVLSELGSELAEGHPARFRCTVHGDERELRGTVVDDVHQLAREAISNAFRHARAASISVEVRFRRDRFELDVADDGCGMHHPPSPHGERAGHWGLQGMHERATHIGGTLKVDSKPGQGTRVSLKVPGRAAYSRRAVSFAGWFGL